MQLSKVVQYAADSNEGNQKLKHIQNYDKRLDMAMNSFAHAFLEFVSVVGNLQFITCIFKLPVPQVLSKLSTLQTSLNF